MDAPLHRYFPKLASFLLLLSATNVSAFAQTPLPAQYAPVATSAVSVPVSSVAPAPVAKERGVAARGGWFVGAEWLAWDVSQSNLSYAKTLNPVWLTPQRDASLAPSGNGVRGRVGYCFANSFDVSWNYVNFSADDAGKFDASSAPGSALVATPSALDVASSRVAAQTSVDLETHDLEIGRWLAFDSLSFRPFASLRWIEIGEDFNVDYAYSDLSGGEIANKISNSFKTEGYGLRLGGEGVWNLFGGVNLFGKGAISALTGSQTVRTLETDGVQGVITDYYGKSSETLVGVDAQAGAAWKIGNFEFKGGYELNSWSDAAVVDGVKSDFKTDGFFAGASWTLCF